MGQKGKITLNNAQICALVNMTSYDRHELLDALIEYAAFGNYQKLIDELSDYSNMRGLFVLFADNVEPGNHKEPKGEERDGTNDSR